MGDVVAKQKERMVDNPSKLPWNCKLLAWFTVVAVAD